LLEELVVLRAVSHTVGHKQDPFPRRGDAGLPGPIHQDGPGEMSGGESLPAHPDVHSMSERTEHSVLP